jgi:hypothetical protein
MMFVDVHRRKLKNRVCQNRVRYPLKPRINAVVYGHTSTHIDVAYVVDRELSWWDVVCVSTRGAIQFPSVLLQPLGRSSPRKRLHRTAASRG